VTTRARQSATTILVYNNVIGTHGRTAVSATATTAKERAIRRRGSRCPVVVTSGRPVVGYRTFGGCGSHLQRCAGGGRDNGRGGGGDPAADRPARRWRHIN